MREIPEGSIDLVLTDPPYGTTVCKWDSVIPFDDMWAAINRVVKPKAAIVMTASQPFTSTLICSNMRAFKYCWVWHKRVSSTVGAARFQPLKTHEDVAVFNGIYRPIMTKGKLRKKGGKAKSGDFHNTIDPLYYENDTYFPKSVLDIKSERGFHPTQKPVALMEYLIKTYTIEGETVLDFTMGSGTTGVACVNTDRRFTGIEKEEKYFDIAVKRIRDAGGDPEIDAF
jgi:site-specific DNA-methyltransferase (adenine-specific)